MTAPVADLSVGDPGVPRVEELDDDDELLADVDATTAAPMVTEDAVREVLAGAGKTIGNFAGDPDVDGHWHFTDDELAALVPPLTRVVNRTPRLRTAVAKGEGLLVVLNLAGYVGRNVDDGRVAKKERRDNLEREAGPAANRSAGPAQADVLHRSGTGVGGPGASEGGGVH